MLYLIGGASRVGKGVLAERLLQEHRIPRFSLDYFTSAFRERPDLGIRHEDPTEGRAKALWPFVKPMLRNIAEEEPHYCVDGAVLLPDMVAEIMAEYPGEIRACFMGYPSISPERKRAEIREHGNTINNWLREASDEEVLKLVRDMIISSQSLHADCERLGLSFFDISRDFDAVIDQALTSMVGGDRLPNQP